MTPTDDTRDECEKAYKRDYPVPIDRNSPSYTHMELEVLRTQLFRAGWRARGERDAEIVEGGLAQCCNIGVCRMPVDLAAAIRALDEEGERKA